MTEHAQREFRKALDYLASWSKDGAVVAVVVSLASDPTRPMAELYGQVNPMTMAVEGDEGVALLEVGEDHSAVYLRGSEFVGMKPHGRNFARGGTRPFGIVLDFAGYRISLRDA